MQRSQCAHVRTARLLGSETHMESWNLLELILKPLLHLYVPSVPCPPTNVTAVRTCPPNPVPVSWVASNSAKHYSAVAVSSGGHRSNCTTNTTSCSLSGLQCGEVYTIGVSGMDDVCRGQLSNTISLNTGNTTLTTDTLKLQLPANRAF